MCKSTAETPFSLSSFLITYDQSLGLRRLLKRAIGEGSISQPWSGIPEAFFKDHEDRDAEGEFADGAIPR